METRASPFLIGLFTLAVLVGSVLFVSWYGQSQTTGPTSEYRVVFSDVVTGLNIGAPVMFNGIRVGEVRDIGFAADDPTQIVATIDVQDAAPVRVDTRAQIQSQGFTGVPFVQLMSGKADAPSLASAWGDQDSAPIIYADPSTVQGLLEQAGSVMSRLDQVVERVDTIVATNQTGISNAVSNIEEFSDALAQRSDKIGQFMDDASSAARRINDLAVKLESLSETLEARVEVIDPEDVQQTVESVAQFTKSLADNTDQLTLFIQDASVAASRLSEIAQKLDADRLANTVDNIEQFSEALGSRSEQAGQLIDDAAAVAAQFRETSVKIDNLVSGFADSDQGTMMTDIAAAARSFRELSDKLNGRIDGLADDVSRFTNKGLRDFEAFVGDSRRTLNNINSVVTRLEQNPARFLTGQSQVREYSGQRR